jgi:uncharacterized repeat protein (TIGR03803 family)
MKISRSGTCFVNRGLTQPSSIHVLGSRIAAGLAFFCLLALAAGPTAAQTFTVLHPFTSDDGGPLEAGLILSGNTLYGTAENNGTYGSGSVFKVNADGSGFTNFYNFTATSNPLYTNSDGAYPIASLALAGNTLYGTASRGGKGSGTVFKINTDGSGFTNLYSFTTATNAPSYTNSDGAYPEAGLLFAGGRLYGMASSGGLYGNGTVFALSTNGSSFTNLHSFVLTEGGQPEGNLILSGQTLFGTADNGGTNGTGSIFSITTNGMTFRNLYSFSSFFGPHNTNGDGAFLSGGLLLSGNMLFGMANYAGAAGNGTVFAVTTNGTAFTNLHSFTATSGTPATTATAPIQSAAWCWPATFFMAPLTRAARPAAARCSHSPPTPRVLPPCTISHCSWPTPMLTASIQRPRRCCPITCCMGRLTRAASMVMAQCSVSGCHLICPWHGLAPT